MESENQSFSNLSMFTYTTPFEDLLWKPGHQMNQTFSTFAIVYLLIIVITSILCNVTLVTIILSKQSLRTTYAHIFVINLAVSDLVTALTAVTFDIDFIMRRAFTHGKFACSVMQISFWISLPSSLISLLLLTLERFSAVMFPFLRLQVIHNRFFAPFLIVFVWLYTILTSIIPVFIDQEAIQVADGYCIMDFPQEYGIFQLVVNFTLPTLLIIIMNILLYVRARKNKKTAKRDVRHAKDDEDRRDSMEKLKGIREDIRAANRILALVFITFICWFAYILLVVTNITCGVCHSEELTYAGNLINYTCIALNPILYGLMNSKIRRAFLAKCYFIDKLHLLNPPSQISSYNSSRRATHDFNLNTSRRTTDYNLNILSSYHPRLGGLGHSEYMQIPNNPDVKSNNNGQFHIAESDESFVDDMAISLTE